MIGPRNPKTRADLHVEISFRVDSAGAANHRSCRRDHRGSLSVKQGGWSDWLRVKFKLGLLQSIRGMVRFHLVRIEPDLAVYASPVNFDPDAPFFPISDPPEYAGDLAARIGLYHTTGMVEDHAGLNNERISEEAFLDQCAIAWRDREAMMLHELESFRSGLFYCLFDTPDRIQHLFWRFRAERSSGQPRQATLARLRARDRRCVPSLRRDRRQGARIQRRRDAVHRALGPRIQQLRARRSSEQVAARQRFSGTRNPVLNQEKPPAIILRHVDWTRTQAYAIGLSGIYLNLKGREAQGIVPSDDAGSVKAAIAQGLSRLGRP